MRYTFDESCSSMLNHFQLVHIFCWYGSQIQEQYSSLGRTIALYDFSFNGCGHLFKDRQRNPNKQFAAPLILSICSFHRSLLFTVTPRYTQVSVGQTGSPSMVYWWRILLLVALVMEIILDFFTLNSMPHVFLHWTSLSRSHCKRWQSDRDLTSRYKRQSSAKSRIGEDIFV